MTFKDDIKARIQTDFGENKDKAISMLFDAFNKAEYLKTDRVIRCIVFLANGNLIELQKYIDVATFDTRDVMMWAEYEPGTTKWESKRIRNFNKTFADCMNHVSE